MSRLRSFLVALALCPAALAAGCGKSPPPVAQTDNLVQLDSASGDSTHLGTATYQPHPAANPPPPAAPTTPSPPSVGPSVFSPNPVAPLAAGPPSVASGSNHDSTTASGVALGNAPVPGPVPGGSAQTAPEADARNLSSTSNASLPRAMASGDTRGLAAAVNQWRLQETSLTGVKRFDDKPVGAGNSWMIELLPYIGHSDLYAKFDHTKGWHEKENLPYACHLVPAFLDPGNRNKSMKVIGKKNSIGPAFTHFVGMAGVEDSRNLVAASLPRSDPRAGIFGYDQIARPDEITDGAANTIMLISAGKIVGAWAAGGGSTIRAARAPYFDSITGFGTAREPGSGALVAMADGSVKRISKDIDPAVFRALCTIHGGEKIDLPANQSVQEE